MCTPLHITTFLFAGIVGAAESPIDLGRCAVAKSENRNKLLAVVAVVSSFARDFDRRAELRQTDFRDAQSLRTRGVFHLPSESVSTGEIHKTVQDNRAVCVKPIFVISPWRELNKPGANWDLVLEKDEWHKIVSEFKAHQDILIAPTMIEAGTRARELMHVLEWSRQRVPWADYIVSMDTNVQILWSRMIELFPPPARAGHALSLWQLGNFDKSRKAVFFKHRGSDTWRQCADAGVTAFSRDLVRQMTSMPFSQHILYALNNPFRKYKTSCETGMLRQFSYCYIVNVHVRVLLQCVYCMLCRSCKLAYDFLLTRLRKEQRKHRICREPMD